MKKLNNAFTLTELLVALGVIGILCAILLPVIFNLLPNQNTVMAKRAYYLTTSVVSDMINDAACYPDLTTAVNPRVGFDDGFGYANCSKWGGDENTGTIATEGKANAKFAQLFTDKIDLNGDLNTDQFQTKDGMLWQLRNAGFDTKNNKNAYVALTVDVNGKDKPNCGQSNNSNQTVAGLAAESCSGRESGFDRFTMYIYADGRIKIQDNWAADAVKVNKDITEDK